MSQVFDEWVRQGKEIWQLIEPVDSFHPNQVILNSLKYFELFYVRLIYFCEIIIINFINCCFYFTMTIQFKLITHNYNGYFVSEFN